MERMLARVVVVQDDLYDFAMLEYESIGVAAVYCGIRSSISRGEDGVKSGNLGRDIGDVVEEGTSLMLSINAA